MSKIEERAARFKQVLEELGDELCIVVTQIDPDALGSAFGLAHLATGLRPELTTRVFTCGPVAHPQNRAIINKYDLRKRMSPIAELPEGACTALVDSSLGADNRIPGGRVLDPVIVIDHHRGSDLEQQPSRFLWIEDVGSACTQVSELMRALEVEMGASETWRAVVMALGIYTDSKAMINASARDHQAYAWAIGHASPQEVQELIDYPLPDSHFENLSTALRNCQQQGPRLVAGCGRVRADEGDDLSTIADYFLRKDGVTLVVVWGITDDVVRISARNSNLSTPLDEFLRARFGPASGAKLTPDGKGEGGARVALDLGPWLSAETEPEVEAMVDKRITTWIFSD